MEKFISLDLRKAVSFLGNGAVEALQPQVKAAQTALEKGTCPGNDFLGWLHLPSSFFHLTILYCRTSGMC